MACSSFAKKYINTLVSGDNEADLTKDDGEIHMLLCALDYKKTDHPLTCSLDGKNMENLAGLCGVTDLTTMYNEECTHEAVAAAIQAVASRCQDGDYFIFYYSGHGTNLADQSGDEEDGEDEALCLVTPEGQINYHSCMTDDEFADLVTENVPSGCRVLIICDCCHSGSIADLDREQWNDFHAISMSGCMDNQTSGDTGKGGIFTHSMLVAIQKLIESGDSDFSVGRLYNTTLQYDDRIFNSEQKISIQHSNTCKPTQMAFPLVPNGKFTSPLLAAKRDLQLPAVCEDHEAQEASQANPQALMLNGVAPEVAAHLATLSDDMLDINDLLVSSKKMCSIM